MYTVKDLQPATWYSFSLAAQNKVGRSAFSSPLTQRTQEEKPSAPPRNINIASSSSRSLRVSWELPAPEETNGRLLGFYLGLKEHDSKVPYNFTTVGAIEGTNSHTSTVVNELQPYTKYDIILQAFNSKGTGPASDPVIGKTRQDKPSKPPQSVRCRSLSSSAISVEWEPPPSKYINGIVSSYQVRYNIFKNNPEDKYRSSSINSEQIYEKYSKFDHRVSSESEERGNAVILKHLNAFSNYSVAVAAATEAGIGVYSDYILCPTLEDGEQKYLNLKSLKIVYE